MLTAMMGGPSSEEPFECAWVHEAPSAIKAARAINALYLFFISSPPKRYERNIGASMGRALGGNALVLCRDAIAAIYSGSPAALKG